MLDSSRNVKANKMSVPGATYAKLNLLPAKLKNLGHKIQIL